MRPLRAALLLLGAALALLSARLPRGFVSPPAASPTNAPRFGTAARGPGPASRLGAAAEAPQWGQQAVLGAACLAAVGLLRSFARPGAALPRAARVVMQGAFYGRRSPKANQFKKHFSGRRKRLGAPGRTCMLSGKTTNKVVRVSWAGHKAPRKRIPNLHWQNLWWEEEQKWVKLRVCASEIKKVDVDGLQRRANLAGLDLYAWCKNHWEPGSRQPLMLRKSRTEAGKKMKPLWRTGGYLNRLNKGAPLMQDWRDMNKLTKLHKKRDWTPSLLGMPDGDRKHLQSVPNRRPRINEMVPGPKKDKALADFLAKRQFGASAMADKALGQA